LELPAWEHPKEKSKDWLQSIGTPLNSDFAKKILLSKPMELEFSPPLGKLTMPCHLNLSITHLILSKLPKIIPTSLSALCNLTTLLLKAFKKPTNKYPNIANKLIKDLTYPSMKKIPLSKSTEICKPEMKSILPSNKFKNEQKSLLKQPQPYLKHYSFTFFLN
jgi:hypothetical protein